jgi:NDP-sugar pyrophosphorylase family protein
MTRALIMAGGRGERLRASGVPTPKPLTLIGGVPLLERSLITLLTSGFRDITVAVPSHTPEIGRFVRTRCRALAEGSQADLHVLEETFPLGNIGAAAELRSADTPLLVIYADNLTAIDLNAVVAHHVAAAAALTSAVHYEPFRIPFGEVELRDGRIVAYSEKPEHRVLVSSGVFVLGSSAIAVLPRGQRTEVSWLVNRLLSGQAKVVAFFHRAPWIDINDAGQAARAEELLVKYAEAFGDAPTPTRG